MSEAKIVLAAAGIPQSLFHPHQLLKTSGDRIEPQLQEDTQRKLKREVRTLSAANLKQSEQLRKLHLGTNVTDFYLQTVIKELQRKNLVTAHHVSNIKENLKK